MQGPPWTAYGLNANISNRFDGAADDGGVAGPADLPDPGGVRGTVLLETADAGDPGVGTGWVRWACLPVLDVTMTV